MAEGKGRGDDFFDARDWETEVRQLQEELKKKMKVQKSWERGSGTQEGLGERAEG